MKGIPVTAVVAALLGCGTVQAASVTVATLADAEDGLSYGVNTSFNPVADWSVGAGVEQSESNIGGSDFSGTAFRISTSVDMGAFTVGASARRWKDSSQVKSTTLMAQLGWMADNGLSLTALLEDRDMTVEYTTRVLGTPRPAQVDFKGTGYGAEVAWFGDEWNLGVRYLDYDYGHSVDRVRTAFESGNTERFPLLDSLLGSIVTRAAGAPDRQFSATVGRRFENWSLQGDGALQRDALTHDKVKSLSSTLGYGITSTLWIDVTAGISDSEASDSMIFGGLALTWRAQATGD